MGYGAVDTYLLVRLRQYCNGARSCMVSKNTEKGSISRNSLSPQPKTGHSGKRHMCAFPIYSPSSSSQVPTIHSKTKVHRPKTLDYGHDFNKAYVQLYKALPMRASAPRGRALCSFLQSTSSTEVESYSFCSLPVCQW